MEKKLKRQIVKFVPICFYFLLALSFGMQCGQFPVITGNVRETVTGKGARAGGTVYILADGTIDPPEAPIQKNGETYILTGNMSFEGIDGIVIQRDEIIFDGAGRTIQGTESGIGIDLSGRSHVIIQSTNIQNFYRGIVLGSSSDNSITRNTITNNYHAIWLDSSSNNSLARATKTSQYSSVTFVVTNG